jgi:long-chain acyl-CoA synthetase
MAKTPGEFIIYDDAYRGWTYSYSDIAGMAKALRSRLRGAEIRQGQTVAVWSESRPGWIAALWACLLEGIILVPIEPHSSLELFQRIAHKVRPSLILRGERVPALGREAASGAPVWLLREIEDGPPEPERAGGLSYERRSRRNCLHFRHNSRA